MSQNSFKSKRQPYLVHIQDSDSESEFKESTENDDSIDSLNESQEESAKSDLEFCVKYQIFAQRNKTQTYSIYVG